jgi:uncharacterized protein DUF4386
MRSTRRQARFAGLLYVLMIVTGLPGLVLIPNALVVRGDAPATAGHLRASEALFRMGIASELCYQVLFLFLGLALYRLFESVSKRTATQLLILVLVSIPVTFLDVVNQLAALILAGAPPFMATFTRPQLDSLAYLFLRLHGEAIGIVWVFWALWLVPFGLLALRSGFVPKILGLLLLLAAAGDLLRAVTGLFPTIPAFAEKTGGIVGLGELPIVFWLLIRGAKEAQPVHVPAS